MDERTEKTFESEVCEHLASNGWLYSEDDARYDRELALFPEDVICWLEILNPKNSQNSRVGITAIQRNFLLSACAKLWTHRDHCQS